MTNRNKSLTISFAILILGLTVGLNTITQAQDLKYDPKGNPDKWNVSLTPFLLAPVVDGHVQSKMLSQDYGISTSDFINTLNGTLMMAAEVSKGKWFAGPAYIYNYNSIETVVWQKDSSVLNIEAKPSMKRHILELKTGMRLRMSDKFIIDPYAGIRYTHYYIFGSIDGIKNVTELDEKENFWDPIIGFEAHFYPHPRIPIELKADCGGFGVGSKFTWSANLNLGYAFSPGVDLLIGFCALQNEYENEISSGSTYGLTSLTYGINFGARFYIPGRYRDPAIFKKVK